MTDLTTLNPDIARAPAKTTQNPKVSESGGSTVRAPSAAKDGDKRSKPTANVNRQTKAAKVEAMLARKSGVTLDQMCEATGWQAHTCRAFISGLRKKGRVVVRETGKAGKSIYRFGSARFAAKVG